MIRFAALISVQCEISLALTTVHIIRSPIGICTFLSFSCSWHTILKRCRVHRQVSRFFAFFHADERPIFSGFKSASIARSQVWLGPPIGRFQSEGGFWIADATER